ncbi:gliding motility lipoprotein GldD [Chitinophaga caeni]|uniref:Gliding motility lipoprotein GldD n=1 Tax=Chitinophaga caeni TaxID=2029983 RepID=A0A291QSF4_9BACT|nr:gliding motility lipoprotein GldD [Chitinophaga caeni]ATL46803.1 gliding motility lipoprotein GldD [Chitinophaga caeni]
MNKYSVKAKFLVIILFFCSAFVACQNNYTPKPKGYFLIELPEKSYRLFNEPGYPYTFEYPTYANIVKDTTFFDEKAENPYWINIEFPEFHSKLYMSYKIIGANKRNSFENLVDDAFKLTYKHTYKASYIDEQEFSTPNNVYGLYYNVGGNAASAKQFFATDSTKHFIRGALYFYAPPNADSLQPVINFLQADMYHLVETLKWK